MGEQLGAIPASVSVGSQRAIGVATGVGGGGEERAARPLALFNAALALSSLNLARFSVVGERFDVNFDGFCQRAEGSQGETCFSKAREVGTDVRTYPVLPSYVRACLRPGLGCRLGVWGLATSYHVRPFYPKSHCVACVAWRGLTRHFIKSFLYV